MRKRLILVVTLGLGILITLILYNLWHGNKPAAHLAAHSSVLPDPANAADIAWFNEAKSDNIEMGSAQHPAVLPQIAKRTHQEDLPDPSVNQAPIGSNQIRVEVKNPNQPPASLPLPNMEKTENSFLTSARQGQPDYLPDMVHPIASPYEIKTGTIIPAILITGINSDLPGPITAQTRENVYDTVSGRYLLIPQGSRIQGIYDSAVAFGQKRVLIAWQRLIFPNGQSLRLSGMPGTDLSGYAGFHDLTNNHFAQLFGSVLLMSTIGAGLQLSQPASNNNNNQPSVNQILAQNTGISLSQTADQLLQKNLNIQPTLEIRPGYLFNISVTQDMVFPFPERT